MKMVCFEFRNQNTDSGDPASCLRKYSVVLLNFHFNNISNRSQIVNESIITVDKGRAVCACKQSDKH